MDLKNTSSSDYLTYKKSRMNPGRVKRVEKRVEKAKRVFKLSLVTFCIMFVCVVFFIKKYAKRVDIEYGRQGVEVAEEGTKVNLNENFEFDSDKRTIDKRLILIQEEENAPSESRILPQDRDKNEVMNLEHFERLKSNDDEIEFEEETPEPPKPAPVQPSNTQAQPNTTAPALPSARQNEASAPKVETQGAFAPIELPPRANIKVLIGRYATFEEAKTAQNAIKNSKARIAPFIKKVDNVYSLQLGSYSNMDVARSIAGSYAKEGFDVWIYQQ